MPCGVMSGSVVAMSAKFKLATAGVGKPGGANPGAAVMPCCYVVMMGVVDTCVVTACGSEARRCEATSSALVVVVVAGGIGDSGLTSPRSCPLVLSS